MQNVISTPTLKLLIPYYDKTTNHLEHRVPSSLLHFLALCMFHFPLHRSQRLHSYQARLNSIRNVTNATDTMYGGAHSGRLARLERNGSSAMHGDTFKNSNQTKSKILYLLLTQRNTESSLWSAIIELQLLTFLCVLRSTDELRT